VISYLDDILVFSKNEDDHRIGIRELNIMGKETDDQDKSIFIERNVSGYCGVYSDMSYVLIARRK
jgi:hypothetical protein